MARKAVAPYAGAWIEMDAVARQYQQNIGRALRGRVD